MDMGRTIYWTLDKILEVAEKCRTYRQFCYAYPLAYQAAYSRDYLPAVRSHCGWTQANFERTVDLPPMHPLPLRQVIQEHGSLFLQAMDDPKWPMETRAIPLKEEIL